MTPSLTASRYLFFDRRDEKKKTVLNAQLLVQKKDGMSVVHIKEEEEDDLCLPLT
jgi:hypothetical protein